MRLPQCTVRALELALTAAIPFLSLLLPCPQARLSSGLRSSHPALVAQVLPLAGGTLRWATLLERLKLQQHAEGGIAGQQQQQQPGAQTATPAGVQGAAGGSAAAGGVGAGAAWRLPASVPGRFLRSVQHPHDGVVQLDVCGLARWWEGVEGQLQGQGGAAVGGPAQHGGGPVGPAAPLPSPLLPPAQPQPQQPQHQQQGEGLEAPAPALVNDVEAVQGLPLRLLPLWAFPGTAAERAFRRYLAGRLAPSAEGDAAVGPPPGKSLSQLLAVRVSLVSARRAALCYRLSLVPRTLRRMKPEADGSCPAPPIRPSADAYTCHPAGRVLTSLASFPPATRRPPRPTRPAPPPRPSSPS